MEQKSVKSNNMKAFAIVYQINGHWTTIYKLRSTNGKQALQTFIRHHWNGLKYDIKCFNFFGKVYFDADETLAMKWFAKKEGFATLVALEMMK